MRLSAYTKLTPTFDPLSWKVARAMITQDLQNLCNRDSTKPSHFEKCDGKASTFRYPFWFCEAIRLHQIAHNCDYIFQRFQRVTPSKGSSPISKVFPSVHIHYSAQSKPPRPLIIMIREMMSSELTLPVFLPTLALWTTSFLSPSCIPFSPAQA